MKGQMDYESQELLNRYLLFHYGQAEDLAPFPFIPREWLHFPVRCITECLDFSRLTPQSTALDLGCSVGRSSFELARYCSQVSAVDISQGFIAAAKNIQKKGSLPYQMLEVGNISVERVAQLPPQIKRERVDFICEDVTEFLAHASPYDVVVAANLICRLQDPTIFLQRLQNAVKNQGQLILISPYSWLETFTPRHLWLGQKQNVLDHLSSLLGTSFTLVKSLELPFLIREHLRKYELGISQASIWKKRDAVIIDF